MQNSNLKFKLFFLGMLILTIFGFAKKVSAGMAYYFDGTRTSANSTGAGTYANPFYTMAQANTKAFATGDDLYFKVGTSYTVPVGQYLNIDWNGTSGDWVIVGAYYGENQFGLDGGLRPILDANNSSSALEEIGIIQRTGVYPTRLNAYVEVRDIRVDEPYKYGVLGSDLNYFKITNCYIYHGYKSGSITVVRSQEVIIDGNTIDYGAYSGPNSGGLLQVGQYGTNNVTVTNNIVSGLGTEGITIYHSGNNYEISGNIVFDTYNVGIYVDRAKHVNIHDNIVYLSSSPPQRRVMWVGIGVDNELEAGFCHTGNVNIYNNKIAGSSVGIMIAAENKSCVNQYIEVYDNIIADAKDYNFRTFNGHSTWNNINIYNNISYTSNNSTMHHADYYSPAGITWGANIFDDAVTGNAGIEACTVVSPLAKTSGWNNLTAGAVSASDFALSNTGSAGRLACFGGGGDTAAPSAPSGLSVE